MAEYALLNYDNTHLRLVQIIKSTCTVKILINLLFHASAQPSLNNRLRTCDPTIKQ